MEALYDFLNWAWEQHHNPLSWYIRPLFLLPYCYFAYKKSILGLVATVLALATSMFWFPKPEQSDPQAMAFFEMERQYLTGDWTIAKFAVVAWVPVFFTLLGWAFWRRSWIIGCVVIRSGLYLPLPHVKINVGAISAFPSADVIGRAVAGPHTYNCKST